MSAASRPFEFRVRPARQEDLSAVAHVAREGWTHAYRGLLSQEAIDQQLANWYSPEMMNRRLSAGGLEVADLEGRVVGFVQHASTGGRVHEVFALYVLPAVLRAGAGWAMWQRVQEAATSAGSDAIELWVLDGNKLGLDWYQRQGGVAVGERDVDLLDGSHVELRYRFVAMSRP